MLSLESFIHVKKQIYELLGKVLNVSLSEIHKEKKSHFTINSRNWNTVIVFVPSGLILMAFKCLCSQEFPLTYLHHKFLLSENVQKSLREGLDVKKHWEYLTHCFRRTVQFLVKLIKYSNVPCSSFWQHKASPFCPFSWRSALNWIFFLYKCPFT